MFNHNRLIPLLNRITYDSYYLLTIIIFNLILYCFYFLIVYNIIFYNIIYVFSTLIFIFGIL